MKKLQISNREKINNKNNPKVRPVLQAAQVLPRIPLPIHNHNQKEPLGKNGLNDSHILNVDITLCFTDKTTIIFSMLFLLVNIQIKYNK